MVRLPIVPLQGLGAVARGREPLKDHQRSYTRGHYTRRERPAATEGYGK
jgi:hypothetical protein